MEKTNWSITSEYMGWTKEEFLFTYSESEKQEWEMNKNNADLILRPKFIPLYPKLLQDGYWLVESILFWFIEFFLSNNDKFYCTNEQMAQLLNCSEHTVSDAIKSLEKRWDIVLCKKIKAWWWKIRFIKLWNYENAKIAFREMQKVHWIDNKIIENNNKTPKEKFSFTLNKKLNVKLADICIGDLTFSDNVIEWLNEYNNTRNKKLEKLTDKWFKLVIDKLIKYWHWTEEWMIAVLKQSIENGWEWLFEVKWFKPKVDYENDLWLFLNRLKTDYEWLKKELGNDKFFELKKKALEYWAANKLL